MDNASAKIPDIVSFTTYYHSPVGLLKISGTEQYISEVSFFDKTQKVDNKKKNLPPLMIQCIEQLIQYFQGERRVFELPIHQTGTAFQQEVWSELMTIPYGKQSVILSSRGKSGT